MPPTAVALTAAVAAPRLLPPLLALARALIPILLLQPLRKWHAPSRSPSHALLGHPPSEGSSVGGSDNGGLLHLMGAGQVKGVASMLSGMLLRPVLPFWRSRGRWKGSHEGDGEGEEEQTRQNRGRGTSLEWHQESRQAERGREGERAWLAVVTRQGRERSNSSGQSDKGKVKGKGKGGREDEAPARDGSQFREYEGGWNPFDPKPEQSVLPTPLARWLTPGRRQGRRGARQGEEGGEW